MPRTTESEVQEVLDTSISDLMPFIEAATLVVDDIAAKDNTISNARLNEIETFYSAYLATAKDPRFESQSGASRSGSYYDVEESGNASYKEVAVSLDPTGTVDSAGKPSASVNVPDVKDLD